MRPELVFQHNHVRPNWEAPESLVLDMPASIYLNEAVPGWLRGNAADAIGCRYTPDRRTTFYKMIRDAAIRSIHSTDAGLCFESMYLMGLPVSINHHHHRGRRTHPHFQTAIPRLREIAAHDHRLSSGFWWPLSAEAEDVLFVIEHGCWPDPAAGERRDDSGTRGTIPTRPTIEEVVAGGFL